MNIFTRLASGSHKGPWDSVGCGGTAGEGVLPGLRSLHCPLQTALLPEPTITSAPLHLKVMSTPKACVSIPSFSCGRAQWTRVAHEDLRFARLTHRDLGSRHDLDLRAREASSPSEAKGRRGRAWIPKVTTVPVFVIFVPSASVRTCAT